MGYYQRTDLIDLIKVKHDPIYKHFAVTHKFEYSSDIIDTSKIVFLPHDSDFDPLPPLLPPTKKRGKKGFLEPLTYMCDIKKSICLRKKEIK